MTTGQLTNEIAMLIFRHKHPEYKWEHSEALSVLIWDKEREWCTVLANQIIVAFSKYMAGCPRV